MDEFFPPPTRPHVWGISSTKKDYHALLGASHISEFELREYLFSRQFDLLLALDRAKVRHH
jgi:hypothetical protein